MIQRLVLVLVVLLSVAPAPASADQNSPHLDKLFRRLAATTEPVQAAAIARDIWRIWALPADRSVSTPFASGVIMMSHGNLTEALGDFDRVVGEAPDFAEGWNKRATVAYMMGDFDASIRDIQRTLALEPRHFGAMAGLAAIYQGMGKEEQALDILNKVKEIYPAMPGLDRQMKDLRAAIAAKDT